jgi:AcrR family transcriptional regulator
VPTQTPIRPTQRPTPDRPSARDRLLAAADELFYEEGVHTVGIDRIIERAGVAKASLYNTFGSKDELVRAYLAARHGARQQRITAHLTRYDNPRDRLLGVFDFLGEQIAQPNYRGCAFMNASAESQPGGVIQTVCDTNRQWSRSLFTSLAAEAGVADPIAFADQLVLLYDGASVSARMDYTRNTDLDRNPAASARVVAAALLDAAVPAGS